MNQFPQNKIQVTQLNRQEAMALIISGGIICPDRFFCAKITLISMNLLLLTLAFLTFARMHGMDCNAYSDGYRINALKEELVRAHEKILCSSQDHLRFGKLNIPNPMTPAHDAAVVDFLKDKGRCWKYEDKRDLIAQSMRASERPNKEIIKKFLILACTYQDGILLDDMFSLGVDPNTELPLQMYVHQNIIRGTPVIAHAHTLELVKFLVEKHKASLSIYGDGGKQLVHQACQGHHSPSVLEYYIQNATDVNYNDVDKEGITTWPVAETWVRCCPTDSHFSYKPHQILVVEAEEKLRILVKAGLDLTRKNCMGNTLRDHLTITRRYKTTERELKCHDDLIAIVNAVPLSPSKSIASSSSSTEEKLKECSICFDALESDVKKLDCSHVFHESCILKAIHAEHKLCPLCRANNLTKANI